MFDIDKVNFEKSNGLVPAIIQDSITQNVLMLGYMNEEALKKTVETRIVTFWSRSKSRIWVKGETSGNYLKLTNIALDCDSDAILIHAVPAGPVCHTGDDTCWGAVNSSSIEFISNLQAVIKDRKNDPSDTSYTSSLFSKGLNKIAQKVGEEATELIIEAKDNDDQLFLNEAADLLYHYMVLLSAKDKSIHDVVKVLESRHK